MRAGLIGAVSASSMGTSAARFACSSIAELRDPAVVRARRRARVGECAEGGREIARGRCRERGVRGDLDSRHHTGARPARRRTGRSRAGSRAAFPPRARGRPPSARPTAARENASSWSAGSVPRPMPLTKTGTPAASANARIAPPPGPSRHRPRRRVRAVRTLRPSPRSARRRRDQAMRPGTRRHLRAPATRPSAGPKASRGMSTKVGPRCGVRAARHAASTSATMEAADVAVAARLGDRRDDRYMVELLQRTRAPARLGRATGQHHERRAVHARRGHRAHAIGDTRSGGQRRATEPARHLGPALGRERRASARAVTSTSFVPACTAPS